MQQPSTCTLNRHQGEERRGGGGGGVGGGRCMTGLRDPKGHISGFPVATWQMGAAADLRAATGLAGRACSVALSHS